MSHYAGDGYTYQPSQSRAARAQDRLKFAAHEAARKAATKALTPTKAERNAARTVSFGTILNQTYLAARREHAWLLRAEGHTYRAISQMMGATPQACCIMVHKQGFIVSQAMRNVRVLIVPQSALGSR